MACNQTVVCGKISQRGTIRYTPAGVAVIDFTINHASQQTEAGISRQVFCEIVSIALGQMATTIAALKMDAIIKATGFLNRKSQRSQQLVLHVNQVVQINQ